MVHWNNVRNSQKLGMPFETIEGNALLRKLEEKPAEQRLKVAGESWSFTEAVRETSRALAFYVGVLMMVIFMAGMVSGQENPPAAESAATPFSKGGGISESDSARWARQRALAADVSEGHFMTLSITGIDPMLRDDDNRRLKGWAMGFEGTLNIDLKFVPVFMGLGVAYRKDNWAESAAMEEFRVSLLVPISFVFGGPWTTQCTVISVVPTFAWSDFEHDGVKHMRVRTAFGIRAMLRQNIVPGKVDFVLGAGVNFMEVEEFNWTDSDVQIQAGLAFPISKEL